MRMSIMALAAVAGLLACQPTGELTEEQKAAISQAIEQRVSEYRAAVQALDLEAMLAFFAETEETVHAADGELIAGHDALAAFYRERLPGFAAIQEIEFRNLHTQVLAADAASCTFEFQWTAETAEGELLNSRGSWNFVFRQMDDEWKIVPSTGTHLYF